MLRFWQLRVLTVALNFISSYAKWGLITPSWVAWARVSNFWKDLKHPMIPGYIAGDASQSIHRMYLKRRNYKINLWYSQQSTLTQRRIFHRRHMASVIQSAVTSLHQKHIFLPWQHCMAAEQNRRLSTQLTTRTNGKMTVWGGNHMETRSSCFEMIWAGKIILMSQLAYSMVWSRSACGGGGCIFGNVLLMQNNNFDNRDLTLNNWDLDERETYTDILLHTVSLFLMNI